MSQTVKLPEGICEICMDHAAVIHPYLGIGVGQMRFYLGIVYHYFNIYQFILLSFYIIIMTTVLSLFFIYV